MHVHSSSFGRMETRFLEDLQLVQMSLQTLCTLHASNHVLEPSASMRAKAGIDVYIACV